MPPVPALTATRTLPFWPCSPLIEGTPGTFTTTAEDAADELEVPPTLVAVVVNV